MKLDDFEYEENQICCQKCKYVAQSAFGFVCRNPYIEDGNSINWSGCGACKLFQFK
jgi:hypothetical protein